MEGKEQVGRGEGRKRAGGSKLGEYTGERFCKPVCTVNFFPALNVLTALTARPLDAGW